MTSGWAAQLFFAFIPPAAQRRHSPRSVEIGNENVRVSKHAKIEVAVGLQREDRTLERNRFNTVIRQRFEHSRKIIGERAVLLTCLIHIRAEGKERG